ncbi:hypothetical protein BT69DRAFT_1277399 [Atractiella rhizophila]|nr:hypothetical protein BT69DRAFT_1277399 [Atractiella rhizophila]
MSFENNPESKQERRKGRGEISDDEVSSIRHITICQTLDARDEKQPSRLTINMMQQTWIASRRDNS